MLCHELSLLIPEEERCIIAVLSHPDDELGMVGTLAKHAENGDRVYLVFLSYGELTSKFGNEPVEIIIEKRRQQVNEVCSIIGAQEPIFLELEDTNIQHTRENGIRLAEIYVALRPTAIITWGLGANHPDHRNTALIANDALTYCRLAKILPSKKDYRKPIRLFHYYESNSQLPIVYVDVTDTIEKTLLCGEYYASMFNWKGITRLMKDRRRARGMESGCMFAEKFNEPFAETRAKHLLF